jgi:uncharacterized membrane protein
MTRRVIVTYSLILLVILLITIILRSYGASLILPLQEETNRQRKETQTQVDIASFQYCAGSYILFYKQIKPLEEYLSEDRKQIAAWIVFKCGQDLNERYKN